MYLGKAARLEAELGHATDQMEGLRSVLEAQADGGVGGGDGAAVSEARHHSVAVYFYLKCYPWYVLSMSKRLREWQIFSQTRWRPAQCHGGAGRWRRRLMLQR
jgi:hypothetical protein